MLRATSSRIILLVQFNVPPEHFMHEWTGILSLLAYVMLPADLALPMALVAWRFGKPRVLSPQGNVASVHAGAGAYLSGGHMWGWSRTRSMNPRGHP